MKRKYSQDQHTEKSRGTQELHFLLVISLGPCGSHPVNMSDF